MNNQARTYQLLLSIDKGEHWNITAFADRVGSRTTAQRLLGQLRAQGYAVLSGPRWDDYSLSLARPLTEADRLAIRSALEYETGGLGALARSLSAQCQRTGLQDAS